MTSSMPRTTDPVLTIAVPCYNSSDYMDACITSLVAPGGDVEIIIIDDGSTKDDTAAKADAWAAHFPDMVRVIHQENAGHGGAVNAGLAAARGTYFRVVDSDDWLDRTALALLLSKLRNSAASGDPVDLVITNYVYEHVDTGTRKVISYRGPLPVNRRFTWDEVRPFGVGQNILMHAATYRTQVLRDAGLHLPEHTFYVDNIFVYVPLPSVRTLYYLPVDLYHYFIGREDQSVNESVQLGRLDQQMRITREMVEAHRLPQDVPNRRLARYMLDYLALIVAASSTFAVLKDTEESLRQRREMWEHIRATDPGLERRLRRHMLVVGSNLPGSTGRRVSRALYRLAQRLYRFN